MADARRRGGYLGDAWLVLALSSLFAGALAGVQLAVAAKIEQSKLAETASQVPRLVPGADRGEPVTVDGQTVWRATAGGRLVGWVLPAGGPGFADRLELLIGLDAGATRLTGLYVLEQKETPGLGNRITEESWRRQFADRPAAPLRVTKATAGEGEVQAVTGATISSESVCRIVNEAVAKMAPALAREGGR